MKSGTDGENCHEISYFHVSHNFWKLWEPWQWNCHRYSHDPKHTTWELSWLSWDCKHTTWLCRDNCHGSSVRTQEPVWTSRLGTSGEEDRTPSLTFVWPMLTPRLKRSRRQRLHFTVMKRERSETTWRDACMWSMLRSPLLLLVQMVVWEISVTSSWRILQSYWQRRMVRSTLMSWWAWEQCYLSRFYGQRYYVFVGQGDHGHRTLPSYPQTLAWAYLRPASRASWQDCSELLYFLRFCFLIYLYFYFYQIFVFRFIPTDVFWFLNVLCFSIKF